MNWRVNHPYNGEFNKNETKGEQNKGNRRVNQSFNDESNLDRTHQGWFKRG